MILQAMYPLPDELTLSSSTALVLEDPTSEADLQELVLVLRIPLMDDTDVGSHVERAEEKVGYKIVFPPKASSSRIKITLSDVPDDLIRADVDAIERHLEIVQSDIRDDSMPTEDAGDEDEVGFITRTVDLTRPKILEILLARRAEILAATSLPTPEVNIDPDEPLERSFFWFPSLSTPAKRKDLVVYASRYDLTGFVLAGKPGLLCLEGTKSGFGRYMNDIKNESWSDIPSYQKKASRGRHGRGGSRSQDRKELTRSLRIVTRSPNGHAIRSTTERLIGCKRSRISSTSEGCTAIGVICGR